MPTKTRSTVWRWTRVARWLCPGRRRRFCACGIRAVACGWWSWKVTRTSSKHWYWTAMAPRWVYNNHCCCRSCCCRVHLRAVCLQPFGSNIISWVQLLQSPTVGSCWQYYCLSLTAIAMSSQLKLLEYYLTQHNNCLWRLLAGIIFWPMFTCLFVDRITQKVLSEFSWSLGNR